MPLTPEQIQSLKEQLKQQIQHLPQDKKSLALQQIDSLSPEALETMLRQQQSQNSKVELNEGVFRSIISGKLPAVKVEENPDALAVLDIAPISRGHAIIIPKKQAGDAKEIPAQAFMLAKKIGRRITSKLKAKRTEISTEIKFDEAIINIIPVYDSPLHLTSPRTKASLDELERIAMLIRPKSKREIIKIKTLKNRQSHALKLNRRIP